MAALFKHPQELDTHTGLQTFSRQTFYNSLV